MKDEAEEREISYEEFYDGIFESPEAEPSTEIGPPPKMLCGEMWYEGELAVLYGETATGKSVFATQLGNSIARGRDFGPFEVEGRPRKVLYFDLKLDSRKWLTRYSEDMYDDETKRKRHRFSKNFTRVHIRTEMRLPKGHQSFTLPFARALRQYIKQKKPDVVIFDSLTRLKHSNDVTRDVLPVMRELMRLKREMNISILALVQSQPLHLSGAMQMTDLRGMRSVCNAADSIFGIAAGKLSGDRYVKQLRSYVGERLYDESHVPVFRLEKPHFERMLGLTFRHFARESSARRSLIDLDRCPVMEEAKALRDKGHSIRAIAVILSVSKTSVQRMLQTWTEPPAGPQAASLPVDVGTRAPSPPVDNSEYDEDERHPPGTHASRVPVDEEYEPEESGGIFDDQDEDRPIEGIDDEEEERRHSREIDLGEGSEKQSLSANRAPEPQEDVAKESPGELEIDNSELLIGRKEPSISQLPINNSQWTIKDEVHPPHSTLRIPHSNGNPPIPLELAHLAPLEMDTSYLGDEIWVEELAEDGLPQVWYRHNGTEYRRYSRDRFGGISARAVKQGWEDSS